MNVSLKGKRKRGQLWLKHGGYSIWRKIWNLSKSKIASPQRSQPGKNWYGGYRINPSKLSFDKNLSIFASLWTILNNVWTPTTPTKILCNTNPCYSLTYDTWQKLTTMASIVGIHSNGIHSNNINHHCHWSTNQTTADCLQDSWPTGSWTDPLGHELPHWPSLLTWFFNFLFNFLDDWPLENFVSGFDQFITHPEKSI